MNDDPIQSLINQLPKSIELPCEIEPQTGQISIWTGKAQLVLSDKTVMGTASLFIETRLRVRARFEFQMETDDPKDEWFGAWRLAQESSLFSESYLICDTFGGKIPVRPTSAAGTHISGFVHDEYPRDIQSYTSAKFLVVNGPSARGKPISIGNHAGRFHYEDDTGLKVIVDRLLTDKSTPDLHYEVTHVAEVSFDKSESIERFEEMDKVLFRTLSLMKGRWVGLVGPWLYKSGTLVTVLPRSTKVSSSGKNQNWCHDVISRVFETLFPCMKNSLASGERREALTTGVHWLIESEMCAGGVEGAIVLIQAALEALSWFEIVQHRKLCSSSGFENLPAADKIRWLASLFSIDSRIPSSRTDLTAYAGEYQLVDMPGILVDVRNALIHGSPKKIKRVFGRDRGNSERIQLWYLANGLLEQVVLAVAGYNGKIMRRDTDAEWAVSAIRDVPWAQKENEKREPN